MARPEILIARAQPDDASVLTGIAIAAKRHWGYPESWIRQWNKSLTITTDYINKHPTYAATIDDRIVGFYALKFQPRKALLDHLWVLPAEMGHGVGRELFTHAEKVARKYGAQSMKIVGDPHAEGFYQKMGATIYRQEPAPMDGQERFLPLLTKSLCGTGKGHLRIGTA